jgi:hypothetical protein
MGLPEYDQDPDTDEIDAQNIAEYENAALDEGKPDATAPADGVAGIKKPTSTELSVALDTIRAEIAYSKDRNISERQKNLDNPLHAKLPYLTWQDLEGCVRELELRVRTCVTEEALGEASTIEASVLKRSANMERVLEHINAHCKDGTDLSSKGISTALGMHILSVRSCVEKLAAAGTVTIGKGWA